MPGVDPDAYAQGLPAFHVLLGNCRYATEPGPYRTLGLILIGAGPAKIAEHTVAHEFRHIAVVAPDGGCDRILIAVIHVPEFFRVERARQFGRADEIAKQKRDLASFGLGVFCLADDRSRAVGFRLTGGQGLDRRKYDAAVSKRNAEILQIVIREQNQRTKVDVIGFERPRVLAQTQFFQPLTNLTDHKRLPSHSESGCPLRQV